ncbi:oxygenase MpaB family protein [Tautonia sp. JC769]|uniref:oxygenase MpaB family protein n=1 Tax=Tautonia sp. JC769 TaxID=3232135 RepID=UPI0034585399
MARSPVLDEIRRLDPVGDCQRIVSLSNTHDFSFDMARSLEFALFRTYCVPRISGLLDRTGEFATRPQKRYDDTDLIVSILMEHGYESERGKEALRAMNGMHRRFKIANGDYLYVLSTFVFEPIRWHARFGWRPYVEQERLGLFHFWRAVGTRMGIREIPEEFGAFERYNVSYEREQFRLADSNVRVGRATLDLFLSWYPRPLRPLVRPAMYALMDEAILSGFGFPRPSPALRRLVEGALHARAIGLRLMPPRRRPHYHSDRRPRSYPKGYRVEDFGPPKPWDDAAPSIEPSGESRTPMPM